MAKQILKAKFPEWSKELFKPHRYKCMYGGRGGGKSYVVADYLLVKRASSPGLVLCAREFDNSLKYSTQALLMQRAEALGLKGFYWVANNEIRAKNGSKFIFKGVQGNVDSIKSIPGITELWLEEAQTISEESWDVLIPTIREAGSEIIVTFNPKDPDDATYRRMIVNKPDSAWLQKVNSEDNPYLSDEMKEEREQAWRTDPEKAAWVWGGEVRTISDSQVLRGKVSCQEFDADEARWDGPYYGIDFGFSQDPSAAVRCWIHDHKLWIDHNWAKKGVETDDLPAALVSNIPGIEKSVSRADSARPETISYLKKHGLPLCSSVSKHKIEDGIAFLRSFEQIAIHPRCKPILEESRKYSYKVNRAGDVTTQIVDKDNHSIDALRYAVAPLVKGKSAGLFLSRYRG